MPQIIYTGENYARPVQNQGRALQALSQFSQQTAIRKENDLARSREDRNMLAKYMQLDPVYATQIELQNRIAGEMDTFTDAITDINKGMEGRSPTTQDMMQIQQIRGMTMSRMQGWKAADVELTRAQQAYAQAPYKYRKDWFDNAVNYTRTYGEVPESGYLFDALKDPYNELQSYAKSQRGEPKPERQWVPSADGKGGEWITTYVWPQKNAPGYEPESIIGRFANNKESQYHIQGSFDEIPEAERKEYIKQAGGDAMKAANLWFYQNGSSLVYPEYAPTRSDARPTISETKEDRSGIHQRGTTTYSGANALFSTQANIPVVDGKLENAVLYSAPTAEKNASSLPTNVLQWPEGVESTSTTVTAVPYASDKNKTYWIIDKRSLNKISFTESAMEAFGKDSFTKGPDGRYRVKEGFEDNIMIPSNTGDVVGILNGWTGGTAGEEIAKLPDNKDTSSKGVNKYGL